MLYWYWYSLFGFTCVSADERIWASDLLRASSQMTGVRPGSGTPFDFLYMMQHKPPSAGMTPSSSASAQQIPGFPLRHPLQAFTNPFIRMDHATAAAAAAAHLMPGFLPSVSLPSGATWPPHLRFLPPLLSPPASAQGAAAAAGKDSSNPGKQGTATETVTSLASGAPACSSIENLRLRARQHAASMGLNGMCWDVTKIPIVKKNQKCDDCSKLDLDIRQEKMYLCDGKHWVMRLCELWD